MKTIDPRDLHHLSALYALDALEAEERIAFEAHYPGCEICSADVDHGCDVAAALAAAVATEPPVGLKASVLSEINRTRQLSPVVPDRLVDLSNRRSAKRRVAWVGAAAAAVIAVFGALGATANDDASDLDDIVAAPDSIVTGLQGQSGSLRVVWSPELDQVAVFGNDLGDPGPGRVYALWFLPAQGEAVPAGLFSPDRDGSVRTALDVTDQAATAWGVTIEPEGGSLRPTTPVLYIGEI